MAPPPRTATAATSSSRSGAITRRGRSSSRSRLRRRGDPAARGAEALRLGAHRGVAARGVAMPAADHNPPPVVLALRAPFEVHRAAHRVAVPGRRLVEAERVADLLVAE